MQTPPLGPFSLPSLCQDHHEAKLRVKMRYVSAYLLAVLGGNANPTEKELKAILASVGIEAEGDKLGKVVGELKGKNLEEVIAAGVGKLACVPSGGAVSSSAAPAAASVAAPAAAEKKEEAKDSDEEEDDDMGFGLFD
ncbi:large ribosomal subunit protein P2-like isoform X2 [Lethenteron reissneri]|uniref:large ribosomal subunit protein P2-like isoform X2 n=1 Tax=Lethenteron reissneri TaxID=7753 RepID=UPI002AB666AF|nr:large ribosomal subunit protein P2-like isoform X2 [Lethenteron reissneri]